MAMKFYKLTNRAVLPQKATPGSAGYDLFALDRQMLYAGSRIIVPTGIACEIEQGWYGRIAPRSGLAAKHGIDVLAGVVDSDYRGEVKVILQNLGNYEVEIGAEQAIAQLIIERIWDGDVDLVTDSDTVLEDDLRANLAAQTERGAGGFGSTDEKPAEKDYYTGDGW